MSYPANAPAYPDHGPWSPPDPEFHVTVEPMPDGRACEECGERVTAHVYIKSRGCLPVDKYLCDGCAEEWRDR